MIEIEIPVLIARWVDDEPQPGIVEFFFKDRFGRPFRFQEKAPIVSCEMLGPDSAYPAPGLLRVLLIERTKDADGTPFLVIDTQKPWHVEAMDGTCRFEIAVGGHDDGVKDAQ